MADLVRAQFVEITQRNFTLVYNKANIMAVLYDSYIDQLPDTGYLKMDDEEMYYTEKYVLQSELDATEEYEWRMIPGTSGYAPICYFKVKSDFVPVTYLTDDFLNGDTVIYADTSMMPADFVATVGGELYRLKKINRYSFEVIYPTYVIPPYNFVKDNMTYFSTGATTIYAQVQNEALKTWTIDFTYNTYFDIIVNDFYGNTLTGYTITDNTTTFTLVFPTAQNGSVSIITRHTWLTGCPIMVYAYSPAYEPYTSSGDEDMPLQTIAYNDDFGKYYKFKNVMFDFVPSIYKETDNYKYFNAFWDSVTKFLQGVRKDGDLLALIDYLDCPTQWLPYLLRTLGWHTLTSNSEIWRWQVRYLFPLLRTKGRVSSLRSMLKLLEVDFNYKEKWRNEISELIECDPEPDTNINPNYEISLTTAGELTLDETTPYNKATIDKVLDLNTSIHELQDADGKVFTLLTATNSGSTTIVTFDTSEVLSGTQKTLTFYPFSYTDINLAFNNNYYQAYGPQLETVNPWVQNLIKASNMPIMGMFSKPGDVKGTVFYNLPLYSSCIIPIEPTGNITVTITGSGSGVLSGDYKYGYKVLYGTDNAWSNLIQSKKVSSDATFVATATIDASGDNWSEIVYFRTEQNENVFTEDKFYEIGRTNYKKLFITDTLSTYASSTAADYLSYFPYFNFEKLDILSNEHRIMDLIVEDENAKLLIAPQIDDDVWGDSLWEESTCTINGISYVLDKSYSTTLVDEATGVGYTEYVQRYFSMNDADGSYQISGENGLYRIVTDVSAYPVSQIVYINGASGTADFRVPINEVVTLSGTITGITTGDVVYAHVISQTTTGGTYPVNMFQKVDTTTATATFSLELEKGVQYSIQFMAYPTQSTFYNYVVTTWGQQPTTITLTGDLGIEVMASILTETATGTFTVSGTGGMEGVELVFIPGIKNSLGTSKTDSEGEAVYLLSPGEYTLMAVKEGYYFTYEGTALPMTITVPMSATPEAFSYLISGIEDTASYTFSGSVLSGSETVTGARIYDAYIVESSGSYIDVIPYSSLINFVNIYGGELKLTCNNLPIYYCDLPESEYWGTNKWKGGILAETTSGDYTTIFASYKNMVGVNEELSTTAFSGSIYLKIPTEGDSLILDEDTKYSRRWYGKMSGLTRMPISIEEPKQVMGSFYMSGTSLFINSYEQGIFKDISLYTNDLYAEQIQNLEESLDIDTIRTENRDLFSSGTLSGVEKTHTSIATSFELSGHMKTGENIIRVVLSPVYDHEYQSFQKVFVVEV